MSLFEGLSVNVTDAVTQSITDDVGMSGCRPSKGGSVCGSSRQLQRDSVRNVKHYSN
jgi:hypothetical protein